jgi:hypothetical protein
MVNAELIFQGIAPIGAKARCPLWVISRPQIADVECPLYHPERTCSEPVSMSAKCQQRTSTTLPVRTA